MAKHLQKIWVLVVIGSFLAFATAEEAAAAGRALIGKIDLRALVLLHPAMRSYDPYLQAFKIDPARVSSTVARQKSEQHQSEIDNLDSEIRHLQGRIHETKRNFDREMERIANNYVDGIESLATGPRALKKKEYDLAQGRIEATFSARLQALGAQLSQAEDRRNKLEKIAYHVGYTDPEATQKQFAAIINEIRQYTQQIASQKGIDVVLNSGGRALKSSGAQNQVMAPNLNYDRIFTMNFPNEIRNDSAAISGYYQNLSSLASNWLVHGNSILQPFSSQILDNEIFIGGVDLTVDVLASIFRTYKIEKNVGNAVIQSVYTNQ